MHAAAAVFLFILLAEPGFQRAWAQPGPHGEKRALLALVRKHYLWETSLPAEVDVTAFATSAALLGHLTARAAAEGKDRHWSRLVDPDREWPALVFGCDFEMGYGAQFLAKGSRIFVASVLRHSAAARAGFVRGDEVLAVAATRAGLDAPESQAAALLPGAAWWKALGPPSTWTTRHFRLKRAGTGATVEVKASMTMSELDPVPEVHAPRILEAEGHKVGYLQIRGFCYWTEAPLRKVMARYRKAGVSDLIIDVRYNPGGTVDPVKVLLNLLRAGAAGSEVMFKVQGSAAEPAAVEHFSADPDALRLGRIAFITTGDSGSATEMAINCLLPYYGANLALVGGRTFGKPVGVSTLPVPDSKLQLHLVTCRYLNALGEGDYFQGLPGASFQGSTWLAADDVAHPQGDPAEASTAAALDWIAGRAKAHRPIPGPGGTSQSEVKHATDSVR